MINVLLNAPIVCTLNLCPVTVCAGLLKDYSILFFIIRKKRFFVHCVQRNLRAIYPNGCRAGTKRYSRHMKMYSLKA